MSVQLLLAFPVLTQAAFNDIVLYQIQSVHLQDSLQSSGFMALLARLLSSLIDIDEWVARKGWVQYFLKKATLLPTVQICAK